MAQQAEMALLRQLQKSFTVALQDGKRIHEILQIELATVNSLLNLAEQYQCCQRVDIKDTALCNFPELQSLLLFKIQKEADKYLSEMDKSM